ncbi:MAG: Holliday junction resolvase RuvX [Caldilineales bacterium]
MINQPSPDLPATGRLLALDVGDKRIGVAVSDDRQLLASPLLVLQRRSNAEDWAKLARLSAEQRAAGLLIGHPLNADGSAGPQALQTARYAARVAAVLALPWMLWDEYGSSQEAAQRLAHTSRRRRQAPLDAAAAAVILQDYLDSRTLHAAANESPYEQLF